MNRNRLEQPGEFGTQINTEITSFPATISNSTTTTVAIGSASRKQYFNAGAVSQTVLATSGSALTVTIGKYDSLNSFAKVPLTAAQDITVTSQTAKQTFPIPALASNSDAQRTIQPADSLYADFIAAGTVTSQATGGIIGAELFILR